MAGRKTCTWEGGGSCCAAQHEAGGDHGDRVITWYMLYMCGVTMLLGSTGSYSDCRVSVGGIVCDQVP
jgi:hypothetical protein